MGIPVELQLREPRVVTGELLPLSTWRSFLAGKEQAVPLSSDPSEEPDGLLARYLAATEGRNFLYANSAAYVGANRQGYARLCYVWQEKGQNICILHLTDGSSSALVVVALVKTSRWVTPDYCEVYTFADPSSLTSFLAEAKAARQKKDERNAHDRARRAAKRK